jgi:hypothetical protein
VTGDGGSERVEVWEPRSQLTVAKAAVGINSGDVEEGRGLKDEGMRLCWVWPPPPVAARGEWVVSWCRGVVVVVVAVVAVVVVAVAVLAVAVAVAVAVRRGGE